MGELNRSARLLLERSFPDLWVEGEVGDLRRPSSGHLYFRLKDEEQRAEISCVLFRGDAKRSRARLADGARIRLRGELSLFEPRGSYQLIARLALPAGEGDRKAQLLALKRRLEAEGLFDPERKRPLPLFPEVVGVVTSRAAAALQDVIRVAHARAPVRLVLSHCNVQGVEAPASIVAALSRIQRLPELSLVILTRGGGGSDDLSAFNDERVIRAVAACRVPVVCGVGHEIDLSLAELAADRRAATPSNAAELAIPEEASLRELLEGKRRRLRRAAEQALAEGRLGLERSARRLRDPRRRLASLRLAVEQRSALLERAAERRLRGSRQELAERITRLERHDPRARLLRDRERLRALRHRTRRALGETLRARAARLAELASRLSALSPLSVLGRGYAIALHEASGKALLSAAEARPGDRLRLRLHQGSLRAEVLEPLEPLDESRGESGDESGEAREGSRER